MKKKSLFVLVLVCVVFALNNHIFAQTVDEKIKPKVFGLGIHTEIPLSESYAMNIYNEPANKIVVTITPIKYLRFEPEFGFHFSKIKGVNLKHNTSYFGLGTFGMYQKEKTNFYGGIRIAYVKSIDDYLDLNSGAKINGFAKTFSFGPAVGAEYYLGNHFSLGAEAGLNFLNLKGKNYENLKDYEYSYMITNAGIFLRFYF